MSKRWKARAALFVASAVIRSSFAVLCESYFVADEYWQSLEVAHAMVFGRGHLTWEWDYGIRSFLFPLPFSALYWILYRLDIDTPITLTIIPRIMMALQVAIQDVIVYEIGGTRSLVMYISLWCTSYFGTRTLSNSVEALLYLLMFKFQSPVALVTIAFWIRPTSIVAGLAFFNFRKNFNVKNAFIGVITVAILCGLDAVCYRSMSLSIPLFTPLRFLYYNFVENWAVKFGTQPFLFYFYSCVPSVLLILTPFLWKCRKSGHLWFALANTFVLSLSDHKEIRYLAPTIPFFVFALSEVTPFHVITINAVLQFITFLFLSQYHQVGQTRIMHHLALNPCSTLFLMPCHSTPMTHTIHSDVLLHFLRCRPDSPSESGAFLEDPRAFVTHSFSNLTYSRVVMFAAHGDLLTPWLSSHDLHPVLEIFNSYFPVDEINASHIRLYAKSAAKVTSCIVPQ